MKPKHDDDLFQDTTMTFGQHLDELRGSLFKALLGLTLGCIVGFFLGDRMVALILVPLEGALETYYAKGSIEKYDVWAQSRRDQNLTVPYSTEQIKDLVYRDRMLFEIVYVDPRQALDESLRVHPQWASETRLHDGTAHGPPSSAEESLGSPTSPQAVTVDAVAKEPTIVKRLAPVLMFHPGAKTTGYTPRASAFPRCSPSG